MTLPAAPDPIRLGIVGCGGSRQTYGPALANSRAYRAVALLDIDTVVPRAWARQLGGGTAYMDPNEFAAHPGMEAALISSPFAVRMEHTMAALRRGLHVLAEQPISDRSEDAYGAAQESRRVGKHFLPALPRRFDPAFALVGAALRDGHIGDATHVLVEWAFYAGWAERRAALATWHGLVRSHALQSIDVCRWWLGEVTAVSADIDAGPESRTSGRLANLIIQHQRGTSVHHLARTERRNATEQYIVSGTRGVIELDCTTGWNTDGAEPPSLLIRSADGLEVQPMRADPIPARVPVAIVAYSAMLAAWADAIRSGNPLPVAAEDAARALEVVEAAEAASKERVRVTLGPPPTSA